MGNKVVWILLTGVFLVSESGSAAERFFAESPPLQIYNRCGEIFSKISGSYSPLVQAVKPNAVFSVVGVTRFELDDYGSYFRQSRLTRSESPRMVAEEFNPTFNLAPSGPWMNALIAAGKLPANFLELVSPPGRETDWDLIDRTFNSQNLHEHAHPLRNDHLTAQRQAYVQQLWESYDFLERHYPRRKWFTPTFAIEAQRSIPRTIRTATYIRLYDKKLQKYVSQMRLVRIHNGLVRLTNVKSGRVLEVMGNAEHTWGSDEKGEGKFILHKKDLLRAWQLEKFVAELMRTSERELKRVSDYEGLDIVKLPMELGLGIEVPRDYEMMDLSSQPDFASGPTITIAGESFKVEYGHVVLVEPGFLAIEKSPERGTHFLELSIWLGKYLVNPRLPAWVKAKSVAFWTYNELPLYLAWGFRKNESFAPVPKHNVNMEIYNGKTPEIFTAVKALAADRASPNDRDSLLMKAWDLMEQKDF